MESALLSRNDSLELKGVGIIMMLIHHLFYIQNGEYDDICLFGNIYLVQEIGVFCKLCVSLFVFLSGYGLTVCNSVENGALEFYTFRFKRLLFNYWFIWLIFVPIGVFVFHRTFSDVYPSCVWFEATLDFLGLYSLSGNCGYNPTWWFYSCIIVLYLVYPFLMKFQRKLPYLIVTIVFILPHFHSVPWLAPCAIYLLPFVAGIWMAVVPKETFNCISITQTMICLAVLAAVRMWTSQAIYITDTLLCVGLVILAARCKLPLILKKSLSELGHHSMNIFCFHTFIYLFWFHDIIYSSRNPIIIWGFLMVVCYLISVILEFIKKITGFYSILK